MTYRDLKMVPNELTYSWQLGTFAKDTLGRFASQCQSTRWMIDLIYWIDFQMLSAADPQATPP
jgi:hypothetical protein